jgi:hypothetical protein
MFQGKKFKNKRIIPFFKVFSKIGKTYAKPSLLILRLTTMPSSHGGFFERYNTVGPTSLKALLGILLRLISLVGRVHGDGKQISECRVDANCLVI